MNKERNILIIDDEVDILSSAKTILEDEGYRVFTAENNVKSDDVLKTNKIDIVFLDVWMPEVDGLSILSDIKSKYKDTVVIMMSGHAGVETAVRATKMGADNFLEKPLSTKSILHTVESYLNKNEVNENRCLDTKHSNAFSKSKVCDESTKIKQKTIAKPLIISGFGLISGRKTALNILPAEKDSGIIFVDINTNTEIRLSVDNILTSENSGANSTVLTSSNKMIKTTEHLLAALHMYGITNLIIKCDEEIPNDDGSGLIFCNHIEEAGIVETGGYIEPIIIKERIVYGDIDEQKPYMILSPYDGFEVSLRIDFPPPIGVEQHTFSLENPTQFKNDVGCARSFNYINNIDYAQKNGLAGSGLIGSHIILNENEPLNTKLRFDNEFVRHKILDIVGDMYLLGIPIKAKIEANRSSHYLNHIVISDIAKRYFSI